MPDTLCCILFKNYIKPQRIGRKFVELQVVNSEDIAAICVANGITATNAINRIVEDCECDLRRVKRAIWALQKEENK